MIVYLITHDYEVGRRFAFDQGWTAVAFNRFAASSPEYGKIDIRIIRSPADLIPPPTGTYMIKSPDLDASPYSDTFDQIVGAGRAHWLDL